MARGVLRGLNLANQISFEADDIDFYNCNIVQVNPFTKMKFKGCKFKECNLVNNEFDDTNTVDDCNTQQVKKEILPDGKVKRTFYNKNTKEVVAITEEDV